MKGIPSEMKAVMVNGTTGRLETRMIPVPLPGEGEVLVKISAAPVNPSDLARIRDAFERGETGNFIAGIEGSGAVVLAGPGMLGKLWKGRRVACSAHGNGSGTWAEYMVTKAGLCFPLRKDVSDELGSMTLVNPLTALEFIRIAKKGQHTAIINNAAGSALGRMVEYLCKKAGIKVINLVRSEAGVARLRSSGSEYVLNSSALGFEESLKVAAQKLNATLLFDSVCDEGLNRIISSLPYGSRVVIYGNLTGSEFLRINPRELIGRDIKIEGFYLANSAASNGLAVNMINLIKVGKLLSSGLEIKVRERYRIEEAETAVNSYLSAMSEGKVLIVP